MSYKYFLVIFPLLPFLWLSFSLLIKYSLKRDISRIAIVGNSLSQLLLGSLLIVLFYRYEGLFTVVLSEWKYSIELSFDKYRVFFLAAYLVPLFLTVFHHRKLKDFNIRTIFLFYLGGCSGLIVAGDIFNFYICYEVMIMSAYVLVAVNRKYYASIKYMMFGAVSSALFLAGIVLLYASGSYFSFSSLIATQEFNPVNAQFIILLFTVAFFIKAAFFPVSGCVAICHSATNTLVSAFLSSFTIFSGIFGLFYFVILPVKHLGYQSIIDFIAVMAIITMLVQTLLLFFETDFKRCIAGSTVFTIGFIALMLTYGEYYLGLFYLAIHALYKSFMFLSYDDLEIEERVVKGRPLTLIIILIGIFFTAGLFPSLPYFLKYNFMQDKTVLKYLSYVAMGLLIGSFLKFRFYSSNSKENKLYHYAFFPALISLYLFFPFRYLNPGLILLADFSLILFMFIFAERIIRLCSCCTNLDRKYIYINLNYELLYVVILLFAMIMYQQYF